MRASYEFARVQLTRFRPARGVLRTVSTDSIVLLRLRRNRNTYRITDVSQTRQSGGRVSLSIFLGTAPQGYLLRGTAADLIASNAPLRARRKSPWGKVVGTKHVRIH